WGRSVSAAAGRAPGAPDAARAARAEKHRGPRGPGLAGRARSRGARRGVRREPAGGTGAAPVPVGAGDAVGAAALDPPSVWLADAGEPLLPRPSLEGERAVDVAIVGAGYTGLWTAWYLATQDPGLAIAIVESEI